MTYIFRPGAYNVTDAARATITQPGGAAAGAGSWWLGPWPGFPAAAAIPAANCAAAYRAVDTPGSVWGAGPANIAESYVNLNAPGVNDLTLVLNPPPWAAATGWQITSVNVCLKTGIIAATDSTWSIFMKYSDFTNPAVNPYLFGSQSVGGFYLRPGNAFGPGVRYSNGGLLTIVQAVGAGNLGFG